jgi:hypothetical protein
VPCRRRRATAAHTPRRPGRSAHRSCRSGGSTCPCDARVKRETPAASENVAYEWRRVLDPMMVDARGSKGGRPLAVPPGGKVDVAAASGRKDKPCVDPSRLLVESVENSTANRYAPPRAVSLRRFLVAALREDAPDGPPRRGPRRRDARPTRPRLLDAGRGPRHESCGTAPISCRLSLEAKRQHKATY